MSPLTISLEVTTDHPVPVEPSLGGSVTILNASGATLYYADGPRVSATDNQGTLTSGQSATFLLAQWLRSAGLSSVTATVNDPPVASIAAIDADSPPLSAGPLALQVISEDITAAIQADINTNRGTIILPDGTSTISATITAPGGASLADLQFVGVGRRRTLLKLANGVNADMFNIAAGCGVKFRHLKFDGNRANNSSGHIINLPDSSGYQTSIEALDCDFANAAQDHISVGVARNAGRLTLCNFGNAGLDGIGLNGSDWAALNCAFGSAVNHSLNLVAATNFKALECDIFTGGVHGAYVGFQSKQVFFDICKFNSNQQNAIFFDQWAGGLNFQNETNEHVVTGCTFTNNSAAGTGLYSDIVVFGVIGAQINGNSFKFESTGNTKPKWHLEDKITTGAANGSAQGIQFLGNRYLSTALGGAGGFLSYGTGVTNVKDVVRVDSDHPEPSNPGTVALFPGNGLYYQGPINVSTSNTLGNGNLNLQPVYISQKCTLQALFAEFTAAGDAASLFALACYADTGKGYPGALVATGPTISTGTGNAGSVATGGTPGVYSGAISGGNVSLAPGLYWIGGAIQGVTVTQPTIRTGYFSAPALPYTSLPGSNTGASGVTNSAVTGALPATFSVTHSNTFNPPRVGFQVV